MALGGGNYKDYKKFFPGTYSNTRTLNSNPTKPTRGVTAGGLIMDWGPEGKVFEITVEDFNEYAKKITGYSYDAPENLPLREIFKHAKKLVAYRLNNSSCVKAANPEVGEAKYAGIIGNKIIVTIYENAHDENKVDVSTYFDGDIMEIQTVDKLVERTYNLTKSEEKQESDLAKATATITSEDNVATVTYKDLFTSLPTTATKVTKDGAEADNNVTLTTNELVDTVTLKPEAQDGKYKIEAIVTDDKGTNKTLKSATLTKATTPETLKLTKGAEVAGEKVGSETVTTDIQGLVATLTYSELPSTYNKLAVQVTKDGQSYTDKVTVDNTTGLANKKATVTFDKAVPKGDYKIEARLQKQDGSEDYKVTSTIPITVETDTPEKVTYSLGSEEDGDTVEAPKVTFTTEGAKVTATYTDKYVEYPVLDLEVEDSKGATTLGFDTETVLQDLSRTITFNDDCKGGDYTLKAYLKKDGSNRKLIASTKVKVVINESGKTGANAAQLEDNDYIVFRKTGMITDNAGYSFTGGISSNVVTVEDHNNLLNAIAPFTFNTLYADTTDEDIKALYTSFTQRQRYEKGNYYQLFLYDYAKADDEGVVAIYNPIIEYGKYPNIKDSSIVYWLAGYSSAVELKTELTNKPYDGELTINTNYPDAQIENLVKKGNFMFNQVGINQVNTLFDYNTKTTFTDDKDSQMRENKVVRTIDDIHNREAYDINRLDIGTTPTTPEGLTLIWNRCSSILKDEQEQGAIQDLDTSQLKVEGIKDEPHKVKVTQAIHVADTVYQVYLDSIVTRNATSSVSGASNS